MEYVDFPIEYQTEVADVSGELQGEAERRLLELAGDHTDMTSASVMLDSPAQAPDPTQPRPILYRARVLVNMRQQNVVASKEDDTAEGAMKAALEAVERQVRELRKKLNESWKRPDIEDQA